MTPSLRILMLADFFPPVIGGLERHVQTLAEEMTLRGHEVAVVTPSIPGAPEFELMGQVRVHRPRGWLQRLAPLHESSERQFHPPAPDPGMVAALERIIRAEQPDLIHGHGWITHSYLPLRRRLGVPLVATLHDYGLVCPKRTYLHHGAPCSGPTLRKCAGCGVEQYGIAKSLALATLMDRTRSRHDQVDRFIAVSEAVARVSRPHSGNAPEKTEVIPNFLAAEERPSSSAVPRPRFLPEEDGYLLFVGALGKHKGLDVLLAAHGRMRTRVPLVLIGTARADTPKTFPSDVVVATDVPHDDVMAAWAGCSVGVVPSIWPEPSATTVFEAMACGRPIVCSDIGGLPEVVQHGVTGLIVPPGEPQALAVALDRLMVDIALRHRLGAAARDRFPDYAAPAVCDRIERTYRAVLESSERARPTRAQRRPAASLSRLASRAEADQATAPPSSSR